MEKGTCKQGSKKAKPKQHREVQSDQDLSSLGECVMKYTVHAFVH